MLTMGDAVTVANLPAGLDAYAGYVGGHWPTYREIVGRFPHARHLSIAVTAGQNADCLDVEPGDAVPGQAADWIAHHWTAENTPLPVVYTSASAVAAVIAAAGPPAGRYLIWSAHYTNRAHICSPAGCGYPQADATQWTDHGGAWDESLVADHFFAPKAAAPEPEPEVPPDMIAPPCSFVMNGNQQAFWVDEAGHLAHGYAPPGKGWTVENLGGGWNPDSGLSVGTATAGTGVPDRVFGVRADGKRSSATGPAPSG